MNTRSYIRIGDRFIDDEKRTAHSADEIIREIVGNRKYYDHRFSDVFTGWFFRPPVESDYQDMFAEAGKTTLVINMDKVKAELDHDSNAWTTNSKGYGPGTLESSDKLILELIQILSEVRSDGGYITRYELDIDYIQSDSTKIEIVVDGDE